MKPRITVITVGVDDLERSLDSSRMKHDNVLHSGDYPFNPLTASFDES